MEWITDPNALIALLTLTIMEIVLGVDNIIFISILAGRLPKEEQNNARRFGLALALLTRMLLLFSLTWVMKLEDELFTMFGRGFSGRDLILLFGGLFLLYKATKEIHEKIEHDEHGPEATPKAISFSSVLVQIMLLDVVFSLDSVITAVGMVPPDQLSLMITAVIISVIFMLVFVNKISDFVDKNPTIKMLALSFLFMIGMTLIGEGTGLHIPKGYIYGAMAFSMAVELLNMRVRNKAKKKLAH